MPELLEEVPRWIIELGLVLAVGLWVLQFLSRTLPVFKDRGVRGRLMKAEAQIVALTMETNGLKSIHERVESFLREQVEYYRIEHADPSSDPAKRVVALMEKVAAAERELRINQNIMEAFLNYNPFVMTVKDKSGKIIMVNKALSDIIGIPREDILGMYLSDFHNPVADAVLASDEKVRDTGAPAKTRASITTASGEKLTRLIMSFPIPPTNGDEGMIGTVDLLDE